MHLFRCVYALAIASGAIVLACPVAAPAAVMEVPAPMQHVSYAADPGETNQLVVSGSDDTLAFKDGGAAIKLAGDTSRCSQPSAGEVVCYIGDLLASTPRGLYLIDVTLGDGDDVARVEDAPVPVRVDGGPGRDVLTGGASSVQFKGGDEADQLSGGASGDGLSGDAGDDVVRGGDGSDDLDGGDGNDVLGGDGGGDDLEGGPGADDLAGGDGPDTVTYKVGKRDPPVSVSLDARADDGARGEGDAVAGDVENVQLFARRPGNKIIGNGQSNRLELFGTGPGDTIIAGAGNDKLRGNARILGGAGADSLRGEGQLLGGPGEDHVTAAGRGRFDGGPGNDMLAKERVTIETDEYPKPAALFGGSGNDVISGIDRVCDLSDAMPSCTFQPVPVGDSISCGPGRDAVTLGGRDRASEGCERIGRSRRQ